MNEEKIFTVSLTLSIRASSVDEAMKEFLEKISHNQFDSDSLEAEEEEVFAII